MTKYELIEALRNSPDYNQTHMIIQEADDALDWNRNEQKELIDIAALNDQVYGTLKYKGPARVKDFYWNILGRYKLEAPDLYNADANVARLVEILSVISNAEIRYFLTGQRFKLQNIQSYAARSWEDEESGKQFTVCDGLYHANSVTTSVSFIRHRMLYSRAYGDEHFPGEQTSQWSDETDVADGVYNDIFFDNCDCSLMADAGSAYGPITFVIDEKILANPHLNIRITKGNPGMDERPWREIPYEEKFFSTIEELREHAGNSDFPFVTEFNHHTTLWNRGYIRLYANNIICILVERNANVEISRAIKQRLEVELSSAGLAGVPVVIRKNCPARQITGAADPEVLWRMPE